MIIKFLYKVFVFAGSVFAVMHFFGCNKMVDAGFPRTELQTTRVFSDDQAALSAAAGLYNNMMGNAQWIANGGVTLYSGLSADEIYNVYPDDQLDRFTTNSLIENDDVGLEGNLWGQAYKNIYIANAVLGGLAGSQKLRPPMKNQLTGEMLLSRAFIYFYLINLFGDVPYNITTSYETNQSMPRTEAETIYQNLVEDVKKASALLGIDYPSDGRVRPNKWAAIALLARLYLYNKQWESAANASQQVIDQINLYQLETSPEHSFNVGSSEAIWQLQPSILGYINTGEGYLFNPYDEFSTPPYAINTALLNAFEVGDLRKVYWVGSNDASGSRLYYPQKYKIGASDNITENYVVLRLAEQYLIHAEAMAELDKPEAACNDLNMLRMRAGLDEVSLIEKNSILDAVMHERQAELFCEWGHRWFDLKRTGKADEILGIEKAPNWQPTDVLYPIPRKERQLNPFLTQNSGY